MMQNDFDPYEALVYCVKKLDWLEKQLAETNRLQMDLSETVVNMSHNNKQVSDIVAFNTNRIADFAKDIHQIKNEIKQTTKNNSRR